jgi:hypothetical protein
LQGFNKYVTMAFLFGSLFGRWNFRSAMELFDSSTRDAGGVI